jgi:hypothetical protein
MRFSDAFLSRYNNKVKEFSNATSLDEP